MEWRQAMRFADPRQLPAHICKHYFVLRTERHCPVADCFHYLGHLGQSYDPVHHSQSLRSELARPCASPEDPSMNIDDLLRIATERKSSDLHLKVGNYPHLRIDGELVPLTDQPRVSAEDMLNMAFSMMSARQKQKFKETTEIDMAYGVAGLGRFRVNIFQQRGNVGLVLRVIPTKIRALDELFLPKVVEQICEMPRGLVLVTGVTGSGKSTTLAAMVDRVNSSRAEHIITIEDPIEFLHRDKKGYVNQREIGVDTPSFSAALRASLRQDPDVILVGEMRDLETISTALHAAETGHMVFSTLHTLDAVETVNRIISIFPPPEQKQIRLQLAAVLRAIVSQRLVRRCDAEGRVPAVEVMINTAFIRECVLVPEKTRSIRDAIAAGTSQYGMQTFDQSLWDLFQAGLVAYETALENASNADDFKLRMQGIASTADISRQSMQSAGFGGR
jgi:twitching motility protein PilT